MAILVTGCAGYIGSITAELLRAKGEDIVALDDVSRGHLGALDPSVPLYRGKIGDRHLLAQITAEHSIESCVHFAALAYVGESVAEPTKYFENNVEQGIVFFGHLLRAGVRRIVFSSTCATYGEPAEMPISENCPQWPVNPYGWSKLILERLLDSYDRVYGMKFVALRYFNAAGASERLGEYHDPESHLIPNVLSAAAGDIAEVAVFGDDYQTPDGTAIRDYVHVVDLADAHVRALQHLRDGGSSDFLNLGTGHGCSVLEVIETARQVTGRNIPMRIAPPRAGDPPRLVADASKAKQALGWEPSRSDLRSIIGSAWAWRQRHPRGYV